MGGKTQMLDLNADGLVEYYLVLVAPKPHNWMSVVVIWQLDLQLVLPVQSVPITTKVVNSNPAQARCTRYNIM